MTTRSMAADTHLPAQLGARANLISLIGDATKVGMLPRCESRSIEATDRVTWTKSATGERDIGRGDADADGCAGGMTETEII